MTLALALALGKSFLIVLAAMLPILNPAATAPIFLSMTEGASSKTRALLARRIARNMFWLIAGSMLIGSYVLDFFGISLSIVRIGGGLILISTAWGLLSATPATPDSRDAELAESFTTEHAHRQAFYPLTFPISCGPASIAAAITIGAALHDTRVVMSLANMGGAVLAVAAIGVLLYFAFRYGERLLRLLGDAGAVVFLRLSAFILLCLGVQILWDGISTLVLELLSSARQLA